MPAATPPPVPPPTPVVRECVQQAARRYHLPPALLRAILAAEGGGAGVVARNGPHSADLGWMQINTLWLDVVDQWGITRHDLLFDPCVNIRVGAWILRRYIHRFDGDVRRGIRAYNAGPTGVIRYNRGRAYARRVIRYWRRFRPPGGHSPHIPRSRVRVRTGPIVIQPTKESS